jgi:hypothetical protein
MRRLLESGRLVWLAAGLLAGLMLASLWPNTPLHAVATDRAENIVMATGPIDNEAEAVFLLDSLTGTLSAGVPSIQRSGGFQATWACNLNAALAEAIVTANAKIKAYNASKRAGPARPEIQAPQAPKYMMTTGVLDIRQGAGNIPFSRSLVYIAEANTGILLAYALPWSNTAHKANRRLHQPMVPWVADQFATAVLRPEE